MPYIEAWRLGGLSDAIKKVSDLLLAIRGEEIDPEIKSLLSEHCLYLNGKEMGLENQREFLTKFYGSEGWMQLNSLTLSPVLTRQKEDCYAAFEKIEQPSADYSQLNETARTVAEQAKRGGGLEFDAFCNAANNIQIHVLDAHKSILKDFFVAVKKGSNTDYQPLRELYNSMTFGQFIVRLATARYQMFYGDGRQVKARRGAQKIGARITQKKREALRAMGSKTDTKQRHHLSHLCPVEMAVSHLVSLTFKDKVVGTGFRPGKGQKYSVKWWQEDAELSIDDEVCFGYPVGVELRAGKSAGLIADGLGVREPMTKQQCREELQADQTVLSGVIDQCQPHYEQLTTALSMIRKLFASIRSLGESICECESKLKRVELERVDQVRARDVVRAIDVVNENAKLTVVQRTETLARLGKLLANNDALSTETRDKKNSEIEKLNGFVSRLHEAYDKSIGITKAFDAAFDGADLVRECRESGSVMLQDALNKALAKLHASNDARVRKEKEASQEILKFSSLLVDPPIYKAEWLTKALVSIRLYTKIDVLNELRSVLELQQDKRLPSVEAQIAELTALEQHMTGVLGQDAYTKLMKDLYGPTWGSLEHETAATESFTKINVDAWQYRTQKALELYISSVATSLPEEGGQQNRTLILKGIGLGAFFGFNKPGLRAELVKRFLAAAKAAVAATPVEQMNKFSHIEVSNHHYGMVAPKIKDPRALYVTNRHDIPLQGGVEASAYEGGGAASETVTRASIPFVETFDLFPLMKRAAGRTIVGLPTSVDGVQVTQDLTPGGETDQLIANARVAGICACGDAGSMHGNEINSGVHACSSDDPATFRTSANFGPLMKAMFYCHDLQEIHSNRIDHESEDKALAAKSGAFLEKRDTPDILREICMEVAVTPCEMLEKKKHMAMVRRMDAHKVNSSSIASGMMLFRPQVELADTGGGAATVNIASVVPDDSQLQFAIQSLKERNFPPLTPEMLENFYQCVKDLLVLPLRAGDQGGQSNCYAILNQSNIKEISEVRFLKQILDCRIDPRFIPTVVAICVMNKLDACSLEAAKKQLDETMLSNDGIGLEKAIAFKLNDIQSGINMLKQAPAAEVEAERPHP